MDSNKSQILMKIGDSSKVLFSGGSISCGMVAPAWVEGYVKSGYRMFKPYFKKG